MKSSFQMGDYVVTPTLLGKGSYGEVYKGYSAITKQPLAVKVLRPRLYKNPIKIMKSEVSILQKVQAHNIVKLYDVKKSSDQDYFIFLQYCQGDLKKQIQNRSSNGQFIQEKDVIVIIRQICDGYKVLYQNNIMHRDIKPENILHHKGVYKIADFGFGRLVQNLDEITVKTILGSPIYCSPQILQKQPYSAKCDIWSLGILLYQLLYYKTPFDLKTTEELRQIVPKRKIVIPIIPARSEPLKQLLSHMLKIQQQQRIDWVDLFTHQIFKTPEELDIQHMNAVHDVQGVIKFYKQICVFMSKITNFYTYFQSMLSQKVYIVGLFSLAIYTFQMCKSTIDFFRLKTFPHNRIDAKRWQLYKQTNSYWQFLKELKKNSHLLQQFVNKIEHGVKMQIVYVDKSIKPEIEKLLIRDKFNEQAYFNVMQWVIRHMKEQNLPLVMIKYMQICKNPLINFSVDTKFDYVNQMVDQDFKMLEIMM